MNPFTKIMNGNKSYTATFAINTYTLSTSVVGSGSVNRNPSQANYNHGTSVQVTAVPGTGYSFTGWSGDTTGTNNPFTVILHENKSYTATFTINTYTLSTSVVGSGSVNRNPEPGDLRPRHLGPGHGGPGDRLLVLELEWRHHRHHEPVHQDHEREQELHRHLRDQHLHALDLGGRQRRGVQEPGPADLQPRHLGPAHRQRRLRLLVLGWSGDTTGTMNPFTKIMNGNKSYTATFAINTYTLSTSVVGSGSVNRNPSQANYNHGTSVQVTAVPGTGYHFTSWSGDTTGTNNPFTVILHENKSYTATFADQHLHAVDLGGRIGIGEPESEPGHLRPRDIGPGHGGAGLRLPLHQLEWRHHRHHEPVHQDHEREQELHRHVRHQHLHAVDLGGRVGLGEPEPEPGELQPRHLGPGHGGAGHRLLVHRLERRHHRAPTTRSP